jgi:hypothetical protein
LSFSSLNSAVARAADSRLGLREDDCMGRDYRGSRLLANANILRHRVRICPPWVGYEVAGIANCALIFEAGAGLTGAMRGCQ